MYKHNAGIIGDKMRIFYSWASRAAVEFPSESLAVSSGNPSCAAAERMFSQTLTTFKTAFMAFELTLYMHGTCFFGVHAILHYENNLRIIG